VGIVPRLASLMLGIMIFLSMLMVYIPRAIADPSSGLGSEWTSVFEALAFSGIAFVLAAGDSFGVLKTDNCKGEQQILRSAKDDN
jgi:hypothetical protein